MEEHRMKSTQRRFHATHTHSGSTQSITSLPDSPELDRAHRLSKYVWQMAVRVVCFIGAVLVWTTWHTWLAVIPIVLAAVIPWVAVILANAGNHAESDIVARLREQQEDARAEAYRAEQERLREQAQHAQEEWQRNGDRSRVWSAKSRTRR
jgi:hypothetical protein